MAIGPVKQKLIGAMPKLLILGGFALASYCQCDSLHRVNKEETKEIETAIKIDSMAKTNYALGMQAVRDSLANANKK